MAFFYIDPAKPFPDPPNPQPISAGVVYEATAVLTLPVGVAATNVFQMIPLPARARVVETISSASASTTFTLGDGDDVDRYVTTGAVTTPVRTNAATGLGYRYAVADSLDIVLGGSPVAGTVVKVTAFYVIE